MPGAPVIPATARPVARRWAQVPAPRVAAHWSSAVLAWAAAAIPTMVAMDRLEHTPEAIRRSAGLLAIAAFLLHRFPRWAVLTLSATFGVLSVDTSVPARLHLMAALLVGIWSVVVGSIDTARSRASGVGRALAVPPLVVAAVLLLVAQGIRIPLAATVVAGVLLALGSSRPQWFLRPGPRSDRIAAGLGRAVRANAGVVDRVGHVLGTVIGAVLMLPVAVLVVLASVARRVVGFDPMEPPTIGSTRWVERTGRDPDPARAFSGHQDFAPRRTGFTVRRLAAGGLTFVLIAGALVPVALVIVPAVRDADGSSADDLRARSVEDCLDADAEPNPVLDDQSGSRLMACEQQAYVQRARFDPVTGYDFPDASSRWVKVTDGVRAGWSPPACGCRRLRVWWFGGSAAWGWDQRDEHSLPSQVARRAWKAGVALDIENRAVPAWTLGQEVRHFQQLLETEAPPDLVIFFDGGNELNRQKERSGRGRGADESETSYLEAEIDQFLWTEGGTVSGDGSTSSYANGGPTSPEAVARHAVRRYERNLGLARRIADGAGIRTMFFWQPLMQSAPDDASRPGAVPSIDVPIWKRMVPEARRLLPSGVVDLSDSLDSVHRPVFDDFYHVNEFAADVVAGALVDGSLAELRQLAAERGSNR